MTTSTDNEVRRPGKSKLWLMVLAQRLRDWLDGFLQADAGRELNVRPEATSTAAPSDERLEDGWIISPEELFQEPGPPEHWLALAREGAPELLTPEGGLRRWEPPAETASRNEAGPAGEISPESRLDRARELPSGLASADGGRRRVATPTEEGEREESPTKYHPSAGQLSAGSAQPPKGRMAAKLPDDSVGPAAKWPQSLRRRLTAMLGGSPVVDRSHPSTPEGSIRQPIPLAQPGSVRTKNLTPVSSFSPATEQRRAKATGPPVNKIAAGVSSRSSQKSTDGSRNAFPQAGESNLEKGKARPSPRGRQFSSMLGGSPSGKPAKEQRVDADSLGASKRVRTAGGFVLVDREWWPAARQAEQSSVPRTAPALPSAPARTAGAQRETWHNSGMGANTTASRGAPFDDQPLAASAALTSEVQPPNRDPWPELPEEALPAMGDWARYVQDQQHMHALDVEQRGGR